MKQVEGALLLPVVLMGQGRRREQTKVMDHEWIGRSNVSPYDRSKLR